MPLSTAPALLIGLGARILVDTLTHSGEASVRDFILIGVWQGVGLHYVSKNSILAIPVAFGIAAKIFVEFNLVHDTTRSVTTLLGVALGVLCTEFLSQFFHSSKQSEPERRRKKSVSIPHGHVPRRERLVQFRNNAEGDGNEARHRAFRDAVFTVSDITSIDSSSEMLGPRASMSPLEREITNLRTRASLADSERRRFKEERKWAISQGNQARASQMKWQVRRYTALMQSFHREADAKLIEASGGRSHQAGVDDTRPFPWHHRHRREHSNGQPNGLPVRITDITPTKRGASKPTTRDAVR